MQLFIARAAGCGIVRTWPLINYSKLVFVMRVSVLVIFLLLFSIQVLLAKSAAGQNTRETYITLELKNTNLVTAFKKIEKLTDYLFAYQPQQVGSYYVSIPKATRSVQATLELILTNTNLTFRQAGNNLIIYLKPEKDNMVFQIGQQPAAADTTISGMVTNAETNQPLEGVNVLVIFNGKNTATATDKRGQFMLELPQLTGKLMITSIGYEEQEIRLDGKTSFSIALKPMQKKLDEVVVIGYGTKKRRDLTGAVSTLDNTEITKSKATNAQEALQGRIAGVDVKRTSGRAGSDMTVEIRGVNTISGNSQPLYVVDGIPVSNINDINPADIDRMDILKDASSTAIYGSRGSNGVVIVTTKKGSSGATKITYDGYVGVVNAYNLPRMMNGPEFVDYVREYQRTKATQAGQDPDVVASDDKIFSATELQNIANGTYTDWIDLIKRNGIQTNQLLTISGGDAKTNMYLSAGYQQYEGALKVANTKKYTLKVGVDKIINAKFKFGASIYAAFSDVNPSSGEVFRSAYRLRPTGSAYNTDGTRRFYAYDNEAQITNPLFEFDNELRRTQYIRLFPNIYSEWNILKNLKFRSSFTPDITYQRSGYYRDTYTKARLGTQPSDGQYATAHWFNYTLDNFLTWNQQTGDHKIDITAGNTINYSQYDYNTTTVVGLPYRSLWFNLGSLTAVTINGTTIQPSTTITSGYTKNTLASFLGRANYSFKDRYLLTITARTDGSSVLAEGNKWNFFPSVGAAWVASAEDFMQRYQFISLLKLRASYGKSGNANVGAYSTQVNVTQTQYDFNGVSANGFAPAGLGNKDLTWEKTNEFNAGLELSIFKNRIGVTLDYYNKITKGSILTQQIPATNGFNSVLNNIGSVKNSGIELGLNTTNIKTRQFTWTTNISYARNKNRILDLYGNKKDDVGNAWFIGQNVRVFYNYKVIGVWQTEEATKAASYGQKAGQWKIYDANDDGAITTADRVIVGSNIPKWFGGITNNFTYGNFDLSVTVYTRQGVTEFSQFLNKYVDDDQLRARFNALKRDYWTPTNPTNKYANLAIETDATRKQASQYIDGSYTKISNITLGYNVSKAAMAKVKISSLRVYATATNPFIFTDFVGWDPETASFDTFQLQDFKTRTFLLGVNIGL